MAKPNLSDLLAQREALEKQIADTQREQRADAIAQVRSLMTEYGLTLADLGGRTAPASTRRSNNSSGSGGGGGGGGKVPAKYRNKTTGDTWSGRGLQPNWLKAELAAGRSLSDFAV